MVDRRGQSARRMDSAPDRLTALPSVAPLAHHLFTGRRRRHLAQARLHVVERAAYRESDWSRGSDLRFLLMYLERLAGFG